MLNLLSSKRLILWIIIFAICFSSIQLFIYKSYNDKRIQHIDGRVSSTLKHYQVTYETFKVNATHFYNSIVKNKQMMQILEEANSEDLVIKNKARDKLAAIFNMKYKLVVKLGIDLIHFHLPNNESFFRRFKQDKFGDDLSSIRDSVPKVNKNKKMYDGLEVGKYKHAFRFVFPVINNKTSKHLGSLEGSATSEAFIEYYERALQLHTHFIIKKDLVHQSDKNLISKYVQGNGLENFLRLKKVVVNDFKHTIEEKQQIKDKLEEIDISTNKLFSFTVIKDGREEIIIFLPILDIKKGETNAFFVIYDDKNSLHILKNDFINQTIVGIIVSMLLTYLIFKILVSRQSLEIEVENKTKELKELNSNLEKIVDEQTIELQANIDIISKYVIYSRTNTKGKIIDVSDALCKISGYTKDELIGSSHSMIKSPDTSPEVFNDMWKTILSGNEWKGEIKNIKKDGGYYWVNTSILPEYDEDNKLKSFMAIRDDITDKKDFQRQHLQLLEAEKLASLGEMIGNIAHQWRQPLSYISTIASGIQMKQTVGIFDVNDLSDEMEKIMNRVEYLSNVIDTFRNYLMEKKELKEVSLQDRIDISLSIVGIALKDRNIKLVKNIDYDSPIILSLVVGELDQVIINIINNAKDILLEKMVDEPWVKIELRKENDKAILTIEDNAGGIPDDIIPHIFEPYFTTKHKSQGTGLGLHMSYNIINESLKGILWVENTQNGAKFYIELPLS